MLLINDNWSLFLSGNIIGIFQCCVVFTYGVFNRKLNWKIRNVTNFSKWPHVVKNNSLFTKTCLQFSQVNQIFQISNVEPLNNIFWWIYNEIWQFLSFVIEFWVKWGKFTKNIKFTIEAERILFKTKQTRKMSIWTSINHKQQKRIRQDFLSTLYVLKDIFEL